MSDGMPGDPLAPAPPPEPAPQGAPANPPAPASPPPPAPGSASATPPHDASHRRRRRRRSHHESPDEGGAFRYSKRIVAIGGLLAIVAAAVLAALVLSQQPGPVAVASPTAALPTLPGDSPWISTPRPTAVPSVQPATPAPSASGAPSLAASPSARASLPPGGVMARRIRVPSVGIDLPVVEGDGVDAPLGKAAHYPGTAWPGQDRNIYLYAHARDGMFIALWDAKVGDAVDLTLADGTTRAYRITQVLPKVAWNAVQYLDPGDREILTLQTCTSYTQTAPRYIVIAEPVG